MKTKRVALDKDVILTTMTLIQSLTEENVRDSGPEVEMQTEVTDLMPPELLEVPIEAVVEAEGVLKGHLTNPKNKMGI